MGLVSPAARSPGRAGPSKWERLYEAAPAGATKAAGAVLESPLGGGSGGPAARGGHDGFHGRKAKQLDEMLQVSRIVADAIPGEAVIATGQNPHAALLQI